jgi:hypothetical protein
MCRDFKILTLETCEPSRSYIARKSYLASRTLVIQLMFLLTTVSATGTHTLVLGVPLLLEAQIQFLGAKKMLLGAK